MELQNPNNGENQNSSEGRNVRIFSNGETFDSDQSSQFFNDEIDSTCSTPYVSAPSSPGRCHNGYFFSAPASPMHFVLSSSVSSSAAFISSSSDLSVSGSFEFEFSARFPSSGSITAGSMSSADELFLNGQIRPMKLSSHLQRPQILAPLLDLEVEDEEDEERKDLGGFEFLKREDSMVRGREIRLRNRSLHRRTRSMSPLRSTPSEWHEEEEEDHEESEIVERENEERDLDLEEKQVDDPSTETTPSVSASSSRSSSSGRNSKRWIFLKDFLRSKSEGRGNTKEKFWHSISFSPVKDKKPSSISKDKLPSSSISSPTTESTPKAKRKSVPAKKSVTGKPTNGVGKRRIPPSPHELLYTANRAQAEEMKKKTYLPYRQGLLGCLGFSSKGYGAMNVFARSLNPVSSR
ncbi:Protein of unknown function DUF1645 [Macleaya cordata]|uniref:Calmodulin-binding protein n=1 Tax=Macleaya cordata TaxID=56857 RepID=A0A200R284_MACCD|nr:Protein of unknown function DUF1645 [Macleaya cordata]